MTLRACFVRRLVGDGFVVFALAVGEEARVPEIAFFVALYAMNRLSVSAPTRLFFLGIRHVFCGLHSTIRLGKCARKLSKIVEFVSMLIIIMARNILCVDINLK
jgi:hypothetical protein